MRSKLLQLLLLFSRPHGARADANAGGTAARTCASGLHADCYDEGCCAEKELACFKRPNRAHAQCLPRQKHCVDSNEWLCPGWELCGKRLEECSLSACCESTDDECYQKDGEYAQCRLKGTCVGKKDAETNIPWLCSVLYPPESCTYDWQECTTSKCCINAHKGFTCMEKTDTCAKALSNLSSEFSFTSHQPYCYMPSCSGWRTAYTGTHAACDGVPTLPTLSPTPALSTTRASKTITSSTRTVSHTPGVQTLSTQTARYARARWRIAPSSAQPLL